MPKTRSQRKIIRVFAETCSGEGNKIELEEIKFNIAVTKYLFSQFKHAKSDSWALQ